MNRKNAKRISRVCVNLLIGVVFCVVMYCINYGISWINDFSYVDMLYRTLPFICLSIMGLLAFGIAADKITEKREREIRKRKRIFLLKKIYRNSNKLIVERRIPKFEIFG